MPKYLYKNIDSVWLICHTEKYFPFLMLQVIFTFITYCFESTYLLLGSAAHVGPWPPAALKVSDWICQIHRMATKSSRSYVWHSVQKPDRTISLPRVSATKYWNYVASHITRYLISHWAKERMGSSCTPKKMGVLFNINSDVGLKY
jgi:hypothetical protein